MAGSILSGPERDGTQGWIHRSLEASTGGEENSISHDGIHGTNGTYIYPHGWLVDIFTYMELIDLPTWMVDLYGFHVSK